MYGPHQQRGSQTQTSSEMTCKIHHHRQGTKERVRIPHPRNINFPKVPILQQNKYHGSLIAFVAIQTKIRERCQYCIQYLLQVVPSTV